MGNAVITLGRESALEACGHFPGLSFRMEIGREFTGIACLALLNEWKCAGNFPGMASKYDIWIGRRVHQCCRFDSRRRLAVSAHDSVPTLRPSSRVGIECAGFVGLVLWCV